MPARIIIVEGLFALHKPVGDALDIKVFVEADVETCLKRRIQRDVKERGRARESVIKQFSETVLPMYKEYVEPEKERADYVILNN